MHVVDLAVDGGNAVLGLSNAGAVNIRKFVVKAVRLDDLVGLGTLTRQCAEFLDVAVVASLKVLVSGGTQADKPTTCQGTCRTEAAVLPS